MAIRNRFTALREQLAQEEDEEKRTTSNRFTALREQLGVPRQPRAQPQQQLTPQQIRDQGFFESFGRGLSSGVTQTKRSYGRVGQLAGIEGGQEYAEANEPAPIRTGFDFYNELANLNLGEAADIGGEIIASQLPNYASIGAGAIAGGLVGGPVGAFAGGLLGGLPLNLGEAVEGQQELIDQGKLPELNVGEALGTGLGSAALDVAPVLLPFTRVAGALPGALTKTLPRKIGTGTVLGGLGEGVTEAAQEINLLGQRARLDEEFEFLRDIFEPEQVNQILNAFATGTIPGAAFGAATSPALGQAARAADDEVVGADGEAAAQHVEQPETLDNTPPTYGSSQFTFSDKQPIAKPAKEFAALMRKQYAGQLSEQDATVGQPHLTLLYGLDLDTAGAKALTEEMQDTGPIKIRTGRLGMFRNDDADVLYVTVEDVDGKLKALREKLEGTVGAPGATRQDYQPHITLNYFQPGQGPTNLVDGEVKGVSGVEIELNALTFSTTDGGMVALPLASDKKKATDTITGVEESARKFKEARRVEEVDEDVFTEPTPPPVTEPTPPVTEPTPPVAPTSPKPKPVNQVMYLSPDVRDWVATQDLVTEESLAAEFGNKVKGNPKQREYTLKKLYNDIVPSEKKPQFAPPPLIQESPDAKQQRVASGYTEIMSVDPQTLAQIFAEDNNAQTLEHSPSRTEQLRGVGSFDAYPRVSIVDGSLGIADGRHRIAVAAERGAPIDVAVTPADRQFIESRLKGDKDNARPVPKDQVIDEETTPGVVGQETEGDGQPDVQQGEETDRPIAATQDEKNAIINAYMQTNQTKVASVDAIAFDYGLDLDDAQSIHTTLRQAGVIDETGMTVPANQRRTVTVTGKKKPRKGKTAETKAAAQKIAEGRTKPDEPEPARTAEGLKHTPEAYVADKGALLEQEDVAELSKIEQTALRQAADAQLQIEALETEREDAMPSRKKAIKGLIKEQEQAFDQWSALREAALRQQMLKESARAPGYAAGLNAQIKADSRLNEVNFDSDSVNPSELRTHWAEFFGFDPKLEALKYVEENFELFSHKFSSDPMKAKLNFTSIKSKAKDMAATQAAARQGKSTTDGGPQHSIARNPITAQAQINLNKVLKRMPAFKVPVILKDTYADLPPHVMMNELESSFIDGVFDRTTGNIYIVRENIADEAHLERVLLHEIFGHYGVESTLAAYDRKVGRDPGTTFRDMASEIKTNLRSSSPVNTSLSWRSPDYATYDAVAFDYAEVMERLGIEDQSIRDAYIAAEVIARTAERGTNPTWFERLMRFVREALEFMGFVEAGNFDALTVRGILANVNNELRMRRGDAKGAAPRLPPSLLSNKNYMDSVGYAANDSISNALFNMPAFSQQNAKAVTQATAPTVAPTTVMQPAEVASIVDDMRGAEDKGKAKRFLAAMKAPWAKFEEGNDFNNVTSAHAWMRYVWGKSVGSMNFYAQKSGAFKKLLNFLNRQNGYAMRLTTKFDRMMRPWNEFSAPWRVGEQSNNTRVAGDLVMARLALGHNMTKAEIQGDADNLVSINFDDPAEYKPISLQDGTTMNLALPRLEVNKPVFDELVKKAKKGGIDYWKNKPDIPMPGFNKQEQADAKRKIDQITAQVNPNVMKRFDALYDAQADLEIETLRSYIIQYTQMAQRDIMKAIARSTNYKQDAEGRTLLQATMSRIQQRLDTMFRDSYDSGMFKMDGDAKTQYNQVVEDLAEAMKTGYLSPQLINTFDQETVTNLAKVAGKGVSDTLMTGLMDTLRTGMEYNARIAEAKRRAVENIASGHVSIRRFGRFITNITLTDPITKKTYSIRDLRSGYREMLPVLRYEGRSEAIESSKWFNDVFKDTPFYVKLEGADKDDPPIAVTAKMDIRTTKEDTGSGTTNPMDTLHHLDSMGVELSQDQRDRIVKGMAAYDARVRRQFLMQRKTTGWSRNYRRTFAANLTEGAHAAAARIYRFDVDDIIDNEANWHGDPTRLMEIQAGKENAKTPIQQLHWQREEIRYNRLYGNKSLIGEMQTAAQQLVDFSREHSNVGDTQAWSVMRTAVAAAQLGGSLMSAAIQATQTVYATIPYLSTFHNGTGFGGGFGMTATMREVRKASWETFRTVGTQWRDENELAGRIRKVLGNDDKHPELAEWLIKEYDEGRVSAAHYNALVGNAMGRARSPSIGRGVQEWMRFFTKVEISNRMVAAISSYRLYYDAAIDAGMDAARAHQHAAERTEETIDNTQGNYTLINRQPWARQGFPSVLMMYQMYPAIMIELLTHMPRKGQAMMLGSVFLAAGFEDLPFAENGMDLMTAIGRWMGWSQGEVKSLLKEYMEMADELTGFEGISTIGMHGLLDSVSGLNIGQRVGFGNMIPGVEALANEQGVSAFIDEFLGPAGGFIEQSVTFGNELKEGIKFDNLMSHKVWRNMPLSGARGVIEGYDQLMTGEARDSAARKVTDVTTWQAVMRMAGATSQDAVETYEQVGLFRTRSSFRNKMQAQFKDNLVDARINNKPGVEQAVWKELFEWNKTAFKYGMGIELKPADISKAVLAARRSLGQRYFEAAPTQIKPLAINLAY